MQCHPAPEAIIDVERPVILVGNPNVGKSALFAAFTGRHVDISNYPGTTVELANGRLELNGQPLTLIDTPGIQSLLPRSDDERVARDVLLTQVPWAVVQVADAKNLRRSLLLTFQLAEHDVPLVLALNMSDEAAALGITVDEQRLAELLQVPVVKTVAVQGEGVADLKTQLLQPGLVRYQVRYDDVLETAVDDIMALFPGAWRGQRALALALLAGDDSALDGRYLDPRTITRLQELVAETAVQYPEPLGYIITRQRLAAADTILAEVWHSPAERKVSRAEKLGQIMVHPLWGWPFLALVLLGLYYVVGVFGAGFLVDWMESVFFGEWINPLVTQIVSYIPIPLMQDFLVGEYGLVTMGLSYAVAIVLPIVFTFFLAFSLLEDSGYLPRLAVMANRPFKAMGLNGKAVLPMVLGLGCDTMATLTTRILETRKERVQVTLLLALGVPCSAQLGVLMGMAAILTRQAIFVWLSVVLLTLFSVGWLSARLMPGRSSDFILELPPVRRPQVSGILIKTLARLEWYLKEVLPLFLLGTAILFVMDRAGLLTLLEQWMAPLVQGVLGLPPATAGVFLIGFLRRDFGAAGLFILAREGMLSTNQLLVSLVVITLFVPCIANLLIIVREHGRATAVRVALVVFPLAFAVGGLLNLFLQLLGIEF